jgi:hypothetical protein
MQLITTIRKEKLPKGYSYPLGAEALSRALTGVPQYSMLSITFNWRDTFWASDYQANLKALGRIKIVELNPWGLDWRIFVNAIPVDQSHEARAQLISVGLETLKSQLNDAGADTKDCHWIAYYDLSRRRCEYSAR